MPDLSCVYIFIVDRRLRRRDLPIENVWTSATSDFFHCAFWAIVIALAVAAYIVVRNDAYLRLNAALQVATGATAMSAEHELNEHSTKGAGEKDLQSVLDEAGSSRLTNTQILVCDGN